MQWSIYYIYTLQLKLPGLRPVRQLNLWQPPTLRQWPYVTGMQHDPLLLTLITKALTGTVSCDSVGDASAAWLQRAGKLLERGDAETRTLAIGVVGPVGTGSSTVAISASRSWSAGMDAFFIL